MVLIVSKRSIKYTRWGAGPVLLLGGLEGKFIQICLWIDGIYI